MKHLEIDPDKQRDIRIFIFEDRRNDPRRYNLPTTTDVAAIFEVTNGGPPSSERHLIVRPFGGGIETVPTYSESVDPLAYPLLFPFGDAGWTFNMRQTNPTTNVQKKVSQNKYAAYRLSVRTESDCVHRAEKLYLQWVVDMYVRIESERLDYIRYHQAELRCDMYLNLADYVQQQAEERSCEVGRMVILPSTLIGGPRNKNERYHDAMTIVREYGKPDLFITFTCNPKWPEITAHIQPTEKTYFRPDIVARVFHGKLKDFVEDIKKGRIFGNVCAVIYTIEFHKRGLPHAHILLSLKGQDKITDISQVDSFVSAEIPEEEDELYPVVAAHMMHGPCGASGDEARRYPCTDDEGKCRKNFPRDWCEETELLENGYPLYRRRNDGRTITKQGKDLDNRWVVPYNPYLLLKYDAHINVEICTTVKSVKYIYKYIYKGYDSCTVALVNGNRTLGIDEISSFVDGRYVGSVEAAWRIFEFEMHYQSAVVCRLNCHLENMQQQVFVSGREAEAVANPRDSKLTAWFKLNRTDQEARTMLYTEIPQHYVWDSSHKMWQRRRTNTGDHIVSRLYTVNPKNIELFYLRMLLLHVRGATCHNDLKIYQGVAYESYKEACVARGIAESDMEWELTLNEALETKAPKQVRQLFAIIVALNNPADPLVLWQKFEEALCEDFTRTCPLEVAKNRALHEIEEILLTHNTSCSACGLPTVDRMNLGSPSEEAPTAPVVRMFDAKYASATRDQRCIIDEVLRVLNCDDSSLCRFFYLDAPAGCGKTYVQETLRAFMQEQNRSSIAACFTGIGTSLIEGGRTLHNVFRLPVPVTDGSTLDITHQSPHAEWLRKCELFIIDEASMIPSIVLTIIDRVLRDLTGIRRPFGGKVVFMSGDFRQTLPVPNMHRAGRSIIVESCIKRNPLWSLVRPLFLNENLRLGDGEEEFATYLLEVGNGTLQKPLNADPFYCILHPQLRGEGCPIDFVYHNLNEIISSGEIIDSAILAPRNVDCKEITEKVLERLPGESRVYISLDTVKSDTGRECLEFPPEYLNTLEISGLPTHVLTLKKNTIIILVRNLHVARGLINGTRMQVVHMLQHSIECKVLTGAAKGEFVLIPRIKLSPSSSLLPVEFCRCQLPVAVAFAMTINRSQGQSLSTVGIYLKKSRVCPRSVICCVKQSKIFPESEDIHQRTR